MNEMTNEAIARLVRDDCVPAHVGAPSMIAATAHVHALPCVPPNLGVSERARADWMSMVAHDLRQPLNTIAVCIELLEQARRQGRLPEDKQLAHLRWAVDSLARMTSDLIDMASLESGQLAVNPVPMQIAELVRETLEHVPELSKRFDLRVAADADVVVRADAGRVEQILGNLVANAAKYGEPGGAIRIDVTRSEAEVCVTVSNRGRGIPRHELARVFDRFARGSEARRQTGGLGLGLHIAKQLVEAHGGRIWANSTPDQLTQFHFSLPIDPARHLATVASH